MNMQQYTYQQQIGAGLAHRSNLAENFGTTKSHNTIDYEG